MKRQNGFTLIELLVVIAIIAVLASMLLPALSKARDKAKTIHCSTNLKAFYVANMLYADEYDDDIVFWNIFPQSLFPYIGSVATYNCPSRRGYAKKGSSASDVNKASQHYALNVMLYTENSSLSTHSQDPRRSMVKKSSQIMLMSESEWFSTAGVDMGGYKFYQQRKGYAPSSNYYYQYSLATRHEGTMATGGSNTTFFDGHVKFHRRVDIENTYKTSADMWRIWF